MARRAGLFGAGEAERESRLSQQRDYAAQLQEQVRVKHAQAEQEKARRRHEQQRERELLDAQAQQAQTQAQRRAPPPLQMDAPPPLAAAASSPSRSPSRVPPPMAFQSPPDHEIRHGSTLLGASPPKYATSATTTAATGGGGDFAAATAVSFGSPAAVAALSPLVTTFTPGPSIFDSLLQSEPNRELTNQIEALQSLRLDVEASWRQRRAAMQAIAAKPQFIVVPSPTASAGIPLSPDEKRQLDHEIYLSPRQENQDEQEEQEEEPELMSNTSGLLGDSVLIPLMQVSPPKRAHGAGAPTVSPQRFIPTSPSRSNSAVHRRLAAATAAATSAYADVKVSSPSRAAALRHDSELLHFDQ